MPALYIAKERHCAAATESPGEKRAGFYFVTSKSIRHEARFVKRFFLFSELSAFYSGFQSFSPAVMRRR